VNARELSGKAQQRRRKARVNSQNFGSFLKNSLKFAGFSKTPVLQQAHLLGAGGKKL
jgi:hypothetical protein